MKTAVFYLAASDPNCDDDDIPMKGRRIQTKFDSDSLEEFMYEVEDNVLDIEDRYGATLDWSGDEDSFGLTSDEITDDAMFDAIWADLMAIIKDAIKNDAKPVDYIED